MRRTTRTISALFSAAAAAALLPRIACAQLIAGDSYVVGSNTAAGQYGNIGGALKAQPSNTVTGFQDGNYSSGTGTSNFVLDATGCNYAYLGASSASSGRAKWLGYSGDSNTRSVARNLATVPNSSTYYLEMLLIESQVTSSASQGTSGPTGLATAVLGGFGNAASPLPGDTNSSTAVTGLYFGFAQDGVHTYNNNSGNLVIRYNTGTTDSSGNFIDADAPVINAANGSNGSTASITHDNTYCVVAKITVPTGGVGLDTVNWWLDPTSGTSDATLNTSSSAMGSFTGNIVAGSNPGSSFSRLSYISQGWYPSAYFDEPRLSTNLAGLGFVAQQNLTWNNSGGSGDGYTWSTGQQNFFNGSGPAYYNDTLHDNVTFDDNNNSANNPYAYDVVVGSLSTATTLSPGSTTFNNSAGNYVVAGAGSIGGSGALNKYGTGSVTMNTSNSYTGGTNVAAGTLILNNARAIPTGTALNITGGMVLANNLGAEYDIQLSSLTVIGGQFDIQNNGVDIYKGSTSTIATVTAAVAAGYNSGKWNGSGIVSSLAAADTAHLTAVGVLLNDKAGTPYYGASGSIGTSFAGDSTILDGDILVKRTYYGDALLTGSVTSADYAQIDAGFLSHGGLTGWQNGDFNYDGVINGSDYTLIDNAFNMQGASLAAQVLSEIAPAASSVPEPACAGLLALGALIPMLRRRKR
jgi:autotransporter-associated beta strand protein